MGFAFSGRAEGFHISPIRSLTPFALKAESEGVKIYKTNIGQPDVPTPKEYMERIRNFPDRVVAYQISQGGKEINDAWKGMYEKLGINTEGLHFASTIGGSEAIVIAFRALADIGETILTLEPTYPNYIGFTSNWTDNRMVGIARELTEEGWSEIDFEKVGEVFRKEKPKVFIISNPENPTGYVYSREELVDLLRICVENNTWPVLDEAYLPIVFDGRKRADSIFDITNQEVEGIEGFRTAILTDSKIFSFCGGRVGALVTDNKEFYKKITYALMGRLSGPHVEMHASAAKAEMQLDSHFEEVKNIYKERSEAVLDELGKIDGIKFAPSMGALYMMVDLGVDSMEFAKFLLTDFRDENPVTGEKETVWVTPGDGFYTEKEGVENPGKTQVRIAYVLEKGKLRRAIELLGMGLEEFRERKGL
jgi:aspartate aminotransferase